MVRLRFRRFRLRKSGKPRRLLGVRPVPTMVTLGNLLCGFAAIVLAMRIHTPPPHFTPTDCLTWSGLLIFLAMVFDVLDGQVARWTRSSSKFGLEMDSLCDVVSFGVAPVVLVKAAFDHVGPGMAYRVPDRYVWLMMAVYVSCAALRLARYNVEAGDGHKDFFHGLPSPAAAGCAAGLVVLIAPVAEGNALHPSLLAFLAEWPPLGVLGSEAFGRTVLSFFPFFLLCLGILMVSRVHFVHIGDRLLKGKKSFMHLLILGLGLVLIVMQYELMLALVFNAYLAAGLVNEFRYRLFPKQRPPGWIESSDAELAKRSAAGPEAPSLRSATARTEGKGADAEKSGHAPEPIPEDPT